MTQDLHWSLTSTVHGLLMEEARYAFTLQRYNELADVNETFQLSYYVKGGDGKGDELMIFDPKRKRLFLARTPYPSLALKDIKLGTKIAIFSRQYDVVGYDDECTARALGKTQQRGLAIVTSAGLSNSGLGRAWRALEDTGLRVVRARMIRDGIPASGPAYTHVLQRGGPAAVQGPLAVLELLGSNPQSTWDSVAFHLQTAGQGDALPPGSLVAGFSAPEVEDAQLINALVGEPERTSSSRPSSAGGLGKQAAASALKPNGQQQAAAGGGEVAVLVILPSAVAHDCAGRIIEDVEAGLRELRGRPLAITALQTHACLTRTQAEEYLVVYKGVLPQYSELTSELASGPLVALQISGPGAVVAVRALCGPREVEVARRISPASLRAKYGESAAKPAVISTDLESDGPIDSEYMFKILASC